MFITVYVIQSCVKGEGFLIKKKVILWTEVNVLNNFFWGLKEKYTFLENTSSSL